MFSVANAFLFRPLPVPDPEQLVVVAQVDEHFPQPHELSYQEYLDYRDQNQVLEGLAAHSLWRPILWPPAPPGPSGEHMSVVTSSSCCRWTRGARSHVLAKRGTPTRRRTGRRAVSSRLAQPLRRRPVGGGARRATPEATHPPSRNQTTRTRRWRQRRCRVCQRREARLRARAMSKCAWGRPPTLVRRPPLWTLGARS